MNQVDVDSADNESDLDLEPTLDDDDIGDESNVEPTDEGIPCLWDLHLHPNKHSKSIWQQQPQIEFLPSHPESSTHHQQVHLHTRQLVPVPVGRKSSQSIGT